MSNSLVAPSDGLLFVVSAPSGTGKTTVVQRLVSTTPGLGQSRSYTSRPSRPGEVDGVDYNFVSRDVFEGMVRRGEFLEWADLFGNLYGTSRSETDRRLAGTVGVFVLPPSFAALEERLRKRSHDPEREIAQRLETARREVSAVIEYDYVVVNDDLDRCVGEVATIVQAERARLGRRRKSVEPIVRTFLKA
jgi:guanylate kinase